jgi:glucosamine--fructose-6-phosphate aminotransferase (isomerizing)
LNRTKSHGGSIELCGIFGTTLHKGNAAPLIHQALERLEYRGYDSVGLATIHENKLNVKKDQGSIKNVDSRLNFNEMCGKIGVGHTRWATHGIPSFENAHPHVDCKKNVAIVHNGIIGNFLELKSELERKGHIFNSRTDTEVIPHLIEENLMIGEDFIESVRLVAKKLKGSYSIAAISTLSPELLICVKKESPLVIGIGKNANFCASDVSAFLPLTKKALFLDEDELAIVKSDKIEVMNFRTAKDIQHDISEITWSAEDASKSGYKHFMIKEIHEQPLAVSNALRIQNIYYDLIASKLHKAEHVYLLGCGTSYHACLAASYLFTKLATLQAKPSVSSEFIEQYGHAINEKSVVLAVSQSGETADTLEAVRFAKKKGASIIGITNVMGSSITRLSEVYIGQNSGPEIGVAATKTFTAQLSVLTMLALVLAKEKRSIPTNELEVMKKMLLDVPKAIKKTLSTETKIRKLVQRYKDKSSFCFLGRGINVTTALEARLKLLELSYIPSLAYPAGESKHGFIAVVEKGYPIIFIAPKDGTYDKILGNIMEMKARKASTIGIIQAGDEKLKQLLDDYVEIKDGSMDFLSPLTYIVPLQLFAYWMAVERKYDPDKPRNLAKSVTVE